MARYVILSIDSFDYIENKTGNMLIRYKTSEVVAVIDPSKQGLCSQDVIGVGGKIPVVSSFNDTKQYKPDTLVIGNAPQAGKITCLLYTSPRPRDATLSRMPSSA